MTMKIWLITGIVFIVLTAATGPVAAQGTDVLATETPLPSVTPTSTPLPTDTATFTPSPAPTGTATGTPTPLWPTDTATPPATVSPPTFTVTATTDCRDAGEPANNEAGSGDVLVMDQTLSDLTLTPIGDVDFFSLWAKTGQLYQITTGSGAGVDTRLRLYDPSGGLIAENDDYKAGSAASQLTFQATVEGWYELAADSSAPMEWGCRSYTIKAVTINATPTPAATPTQTPKPTAPPSATAPPTDVPSQIKPDAYEPNPDPDNAANLGVGQTAELNFNGWPPGNNGVDNDFFRIYVKAQDDLQIETTDLAAGLDTNIIIYREDGSVATGNDDCSPNERRSCLVWQPGYTGLAFVLVGPVGTIPDAVAADSRAYKLSISYVDNSANQSPGSSGWGWGSHTGSGLTGQATPSAGSNLYGQPLPWKVTPLPPTVTPVITPTVSITPLTATQVASDSGPLVSNDVAVRSYSLMPPQPTPQPLQPLDIEVTIYYDENDNRAPDVSEGIAGVSVRVLDATANRLLAQTFTDSQGHASLSLSATGKVRLSISYLGYNKEIRPPGSVLDVRLPALHVPSLIP